MGKGFQDQNLFCRFDDGEYFRQQLQELLYADYEVLAIRCFHGKKIPQVEFRGLCFSQLRHERRDLFIIFSGEDRIGNKGYI